ncbi:PTS fructose transporter subunit IID, partial [Enterococcus cecorum]|nr:PTS fructose transporter subunit IID [Enterococcus cecorum]
GKKSLNSTRVIWIFLILSIICYSLKILAIG